MKAHTLTRRVKRLQTAMIPRDTQLPTIFLDPEGYDANDPSTWRDYPGCEERNREMLVLARRKRIMPGLYVMGPDEDGIDP